MDTSCVRQNAGNICKVFKLKEYENIKSLKNKLNLK